MFPPTATMWLFICVQNTLESYLEIGRIQIPGFPDYKKIVKMVLFGMLTDRNTILAGW